MKDEPEQRLPDRIDKAIIPALQGGPHNNTIAALAVCFREAMTEEFRQYARQIVANAKTLAQALVDRGFYLVTGGTDNHLILVDVMKSRKIPGKPYARALYEAGLETNFNAVPNDPAQAVLAIRPADRHTGRHHSGLQGAADGSDRGLDGAGRRHM